VVITPEVVVENVNPTLVPREVTTRRTPREKSA
jgi:ATP-dependent Clp protease ATP-binding subunit ClpX